MEEARGTKDVSGASKKSYPQNTGGFQRKPVSDREGFAKGDASLAPSSMKDHCGQTGTRNQEHS